VGPNHPGPHSHRLFAPGVTDKAWGFAHVKASAKGRRKETRTRQARRKEGMEERLERRHWMEAILCEAERGGRGCCARPGGIVVVLVVGGAVGGRKARLPASGNAGATVV